MLPPFLPPGPRLWPPRGPAPPAFLRRLDHHLDKGHRDRRGGHNRRPTIYRRGRDGDGDDFVHRYVIGCLRRDGDRDHGVAGADNIRDHQLVSNLSIPAGGF